MPELPPVPDALLDLQGAPRVGAYAGDPRSASLVQARVPGLGPLERGDGRARRLLRDLRRKTWCWVGVFQADVVVAAAVADVGYLGVAWAYVAVGERVVEQGWKTPAAVGVRAGAPLQAAVAMAPRRLIAISPTEPGGVMLTIELPGLRAGFDIAAGRSLTVVSDFGGAGLPGATVKRGGLAARGSFELEGQRRPLDEAFACIDWTTGYFPRRTGWQWATGAGRDAAGRVVGVNLARGVHDDARGRFTENALWLDGEPGALPPVSFLVGEGKTPWTIKSTGSEAERGQVDLVFEPRGERKEDVDLLLVSSKYRQPFGELSGTLRDARGREVRLEGLPGVTEDHLAVW